MIHSKDTQPPPTSHSSRRYLPTVHPTAIILTIVCVCSQNIKQALNQFDGSDASLVELVSFSSACDAASLLCLASVNKNIYEQLSADDFLWRAALERFLVPCLAEKGNKADNQAHPADTLNLRKALARDHLASKHILTPG
jgi:hypothetical protein